METEEAIEDALLAEAAGSTTEPVASTSKQPERKAHEVVPAVGLTKTQKKNQKARMKRKLKRDTSSLSAGEGQKPQAAVSSPGQPPSKRPNVARPMPRTLFLQAWTELLNARRSVDAAMEVLRFYRYDH